jgi:CheY-like chemotaxis protein
MNILIAEDDAVSRMILEKTLTNWGHAVVATETGSQAWALYGAGEFRLVISDWMMPEIDGLELCRKIRILARKDYTYVILLTAKSGKSSYLEGMQAGADDYLTKPFDADELNQSDVETLRGIIPICAWCHKIRDDDKLWQSAEEYFGKHADVDFSHSICPECREKQMAGLTKPKTRE